MTDNHDDRFDNPTRDELIAALDKLLQTPRAKSSGGWADVSFERMHELDEFFRLVRKAVMEPDPDGDMVITWEMLHRAHHYAPAAWIRVPHSIETPQQIKETIKAAHDLSSMATKLLRKAEFSVDDLSSLNAKA